MGWFKSLFFHKANLFLRCRLLEWDRGWPFIVVIVVVTVFVLVASKNFRDGIADLLSGI